MAFATLPQFYLCYWIEIKIPLALQTQQMWAQENDVNFLSAGANNPQIGSGGTGIYVGTHIFQIFK